jgi:hypothetical protein
MARGAPFARPAGWPGRLQWVFSASAGIDFYPEWLLDAPLVSCGRGTASEEIADYVIAAIYRQAKDLDAARVRTAAEWRHIPWVVCGSPWVWSGWARSVRRWRGAPWLWAHGWWRRGADRPGRSSPGVRCSAA